MSNPNDFLHHRAEYHRHLAEAYRNLHQEVNKHQLIVEVAVHHRYERPDGAAYWPDKNGEQLVLLLPKGQLRIPLVVFKSAGSYWYGSTMDGRVGNHDWSVSELLDSARRYAERIGEALPEPKN